MLKESMDFFKQLFVWWRGQTLGTRIWTMLFGKRVGIDEVGNIYYRHRQRETRRWVIYKGIIDASKIPAEWHAWLHNMVRMPPISAQKNGAQEKSGQEKTERAWFKPHLPNFTGTQKAYRRKPPARVDENLGIMEYEAWQPNTIKEQTHEG